MIFNFLKKEQEKRNNKIVRDFFSNTVKSLELLLSASDSTFNSIELRLNEDISKNKKPSKSSLSVFSTNLATIDIVWDALNNNFKKYKKIVSEERGTFEGDKSDNDYNKVICKLEDIENKMVEFSKLAGKIARFMEKK